MGNKDGDGDVDDDDDDEEEEEEDNFRELSRASRYNLLSLGMW